MQEISNLIHLLNSVYAEGKTGVLSIWATVTAEGDDSRINVHQQSISFLFRRGQLVSARYGAMQDKQVLALVRKIADLNKLRWTPMHIDSITSTDESLSTEKLINTVKRLGQPSPKLQRLNSPPPASPLHDNALIQRQVKKVFRDVFGDANADVMIAIVQDANPKASPVGFLQKCIDHLSPYIGHAEATRLLIPRQE